MSDEKVTTTTQTIVAGLAIAALFGFFLGIGLGPLIADQISKNGVEAGERRPCAEVVMLETRDLRAERERLTDIVGFSKRYDIDAGLAVEIYGAAQKQDIPLRTAFRLVKIESGFDSHAVSPVGAVGLTQLRLSTARIYDETVTRKELIVDQRKNLEIGFRYLKSMYRKYRSWHLALLAYNRGPAMVDRDLRSGNDPSNGYARDILR